MLLYLWVCFSFCRLLPTSSSSLPLRSTLVSESPEVKVVQLTVIVVGEPLETVLVLPGYLDGLVGLHKLELVVARELDHASPIFVINDDEYLLVAEAGQLYGLLQKALLPFAECSVPLHRVLDQLQLVNFLLAHFFSGK